MRKAESVSDPEHDLIAVGARLRLARESAGLSQPDFAEKIGFSKRQVSAWETGANTPPIWVLAALRKVCNIDPEWVLCGPGLVPLVDVPPKARARDGRIIREICTMARGFGLTLPDDAIADLARLVLREPVEAEKDAMARLHDTLRAISSGSA